MAPPLLLRALQEYHSGSTAVTISVAVLLSLLSAVFSGMSLGLMVLDVVQLLVIIQTAERQEPRLPEVQREAEKARRVYRLRKDGNLLLVTLLVSNVAVNAAFSIVVSDLTSGLIGFFVSTAVLTLFGEIVPQAVCSRHGLTIGYYLWPLICFLEIVFYVFAKPLAMILDLILGR